MGRPLSGRDVDRFMRAHRHGPGDVEQVAVAALGVARRRALLPLVSVPPASPLDEETWRLGAAVHDLLTLGHPRIGTGPGAEARIERVAAAATALAELGAPATLERTLVRHSLVARLPDAVRFDHTVRFWLGRRTFVGRTPPARILALPRLRGVTVESVRRGWLREVGVLAAARPAFAALTEASPLGEALDPLRLDPAWSWGRVLSILRFPPLFRLVAGRLVDLGVGQTGDALAEALYRFVSLEDTAGPVHASPAAVSCAVGFLAHMTWLDHLFAPTAAQNGPTAATGDAGRELAVVLAAAEQVEPELIWPPDVPRGSDLGQGFARRLDRLFARHDVKRNPRWSAALELAQRAAPAARGSRSDHGYDHGV